MTKEGCFEKAAHAQVADLPISTTDLKIALSPGGLSYSPFGIILPQYHLPGDCAEVMPTHAPGIRPANPSPVWMLKGHVF